MILIMRFIVSGKSMEPAFRKGQTLLVSGIPYILQQPRIGEVVVTKDPRDGRLLLKRIKKIEGSVFFVVGDNEKTSTDSRVFGPIKKENIPGKVLMKV